MIAALVPAAGRSTRMGRPKMLLEIAGQPLLRRVIRALRDGGADRVVVVLPPIEEAGATAMEAVAVMAGAEAFHLAAPTPDMRATIEAGLTYFLGHPPNPIGILLAPGDSVGISSALVSAVVKQFKVVESRIIVPVFGPRRGHPLALPWSLALDIRGLPADVGVNALVDRLTTRVDRLSVDDPALNDDLDTPEDYRRWNPEA